MLKGHYLPLELIEKMTKLMRDASCTTSGSAIITSKAIHAARSIGYPLEWIAYIIASRITSSGYGYIDLLASSNAGFRFLLIGTKVHVTRYERTKTTKIGERNKYKQKLLGTMIKEHWVEYEIGSTVIMEPPKPRV